MQPKNTADAGPFNLGDLCALMALDPPQLAEFLAPLRDLRADGIFPRQLSERDTDLALDPPGVLIDAAPGWKDAPIRLSKFGYAVADLPFPFRWSELLDFFDVEGHAAWEVERKLTNDPGHAGLSPPIDEAAFRRLQARSPALATLVRPLLETGAGGRWWRIAAQTAAPSSGTLPSENPSTERPKSPPSETPTVRKHRSGRDVLAPVIERVRRTVGDGTDTAQVMAELERLAGLPELERPAPLAGVTSGGVQWRDGGVVNVLTRKALGDRLRRAAAR